MSEATLTGQPVIPAADRIRELNAIDQDVCKMLTAAGETIGALTADETTSLTPDERRQIVTEKAREYYALLSRIDVATRRNIYALSEAGIITDEQKPARAKSANVEGQLGNLDVSILNSQNDKVGKEIEMEQWEKAVALAGEFALEHGSGSSQMAQVE